MRCLRIFCSPVPGPLVLALVAALWALPGEAQIRRCVGPDGDTIYTDRTCADVGATERPAPSVHSPVYGGKSWARGCRSEEHTSELQSLMRISYAVFCLKKKNNTRK